ncbi:hypothetical protein L596_019493 [Steinernema carpocapsae]|uniref:Ubiquitin-like protease family profile domain-containing protein n=1 Tax=Steinernema carpocapsae TaxID=34508 RepID=A0A4V6XVZ0_STECR|nr:hypothetical protein L596_019493 [Steinernema carpocapsae]
MVTRAQLELSDLIAVFPRPDKQLDPADFYKFCPDNSHPILPPLADFIVNDDSENADAYNDLKPGIQLTIQTVYSWTLYLMMKYGQGMKPCLVHPQFWEPYSIDTENAFNYTIGNRQDFDILFIPILKASHWTLAVWRCGVITYYDSLECPLSGSMVKKIVEIVMTSREGISVHDFQLLRSSPQTDATNCGIFVLINIEQMLRTGEVWVVARLADPMHKYLYINNARMRMRKVLCPKKVKIPETNTWSRRQISKIQHKPVANRNVSKTIRSSFDDLVVRLSRKPSDEWIFKVMEVVSTLQDAALVTGHIVKEVLNSVFFF